MRNMLSFGLVALVAGRPGCGHLRTCASSTPASDSPPGCDPAFLA